VAKIHLSLPESLQGMLGHAAIDHLEGRPVDWNYIMTFARQLGEREAQREPPASNVVPFKRGRTEVKCRIRDLGREFPDWRVELTNSCHIKLVYITSGRCVFTSGTTAHVMGRHIIRRKMRALLREVQG
jgi:hypothetical protein